MMNYVDEELKLEKDFIAFEIDDRARASPKGSG